MNIHPYAIESRSELGSKSYIFIKNDKIISLTNLFQHFLFAKLLSEWKIEFILPYIRSHLEYDTSTYVKNVALGTLLRFEAPGDLPVNKVKMQQLRWS